MHAFALCKLKKSQENAGWWNTFWWTLSSWKLINGFSVNNICTAVCLVNLIQWKSHSVVPSPSPSPSISRNSCKRQRIISKWAAILRNNNFTSICSTGKILASLQYTIHSIVNSDVQHLPIPFNTFSLPSPELKVSLLVQGKPFFSFNTSAVRSITWSLFRCGKIKWRKKARL